MNKLIIMGIVLASVAAQGGDIVMKIKAGNPIEIVQPLQIHELLPLGLRTNDVLALDGLTLVRDPDGQLAVDKLIQMNPKEITVFSVRFRDVWRIPDESFANLKRSYELALDRLRAVQKARNADPSLQNVDVLLDQFVSNFTNSWAHFDADHSNVSYPGGSGLTSYIQKAEGLRRTFQGHKEFLDLIVPILSQEKKTQDILRELGVALDRFRYQPVKQIDISVVDEEMVPNKASDAIGAEAAPQHQR